MADKPNPNQGKYATKIDWAEARNWYMEDVTRSYQDVAEKFGVAKRTVEVNAKAEVDNKGNKTTWAIRRQEIGAQAVQSHEDKLLEEKSAINTRHSEQYLLAQQITMKKLKSLESGVQVVDRWGQAKFTDSGDPVMMYPDAVEFEKTLKALQIATNGERVANGLQTSVAQVQGPGGKDIGSGLADLLLEAQRVLADEQRPS